MKLKGNTILITGGAGGIGLEMASRLLERENTVIITGRNREKLNRVKEILPKIHTIQSDVSSEKEIESLYQDMIERFPNLNVLINNAGVMRVVNFHETHSSLAEFTQEININLIGSIWMTKQFIPHLKKRPTGAIVQITSGLAFVPLPTSPIYCATKAALHSFVQSLRVQLKNTNLRVFEVAPPATQTEMLGQFESTDMKGVSIMKVEDMVRDTLKGIEKDSFEIRPGQSNQLKFMSRLAPDFILSQMSKSTDRMLAGSK
ncbi:KR domain protein [Leptospira inadai serovar Lyme str. 10]|uniref:KR domain protein n=2 Tax=Leptospira inadai serovar Lyme TaxID=293084 RepID=V6HTR7_9LEPT|nr:SDR family NAD(P)-dependent oxidoreductase [Leptospira inadai]EQA36109.1 KR domain protein [Leptospira inadai serovar Lyme str. 10]PNV74814.1 KR domain-containing protein [Leptospira inadai serovar Lyme]